jgi:hypothetical protein
MEAIYSSETSVDYNGLYGVMSQKIELFITTVSRYSNGLQVGRKEFDSRQRQGIFFLLRSFQTGSGIHLASYLMGYWVSFSYDKAAGE